MGIKEGALALADELEAFEDGDCEECSLYGQPECKGHLSCMEIMARYAARKMREAVERDGEGATTVSAYDLLPEEDRKAIAWVREHGGLDEVEKRLMPEGMEWPKVDGKPVDFKTAYGPSLGVLEAVSIYNTGACEVMGHDGTIKSAKDIHVATPKALDADGVEICVGDRIYDTDTGCGRTVRAVNDNGTVEFDGHENRGWFGRFLTHRAPVLAADGKPLREGEHVYHVETGAELVVKELPKPGEYQAVVVFALPTSPASHLTSFDPDRLTHRAPVLAADGEPLEVGQTVYGTRDQTPVEVIATHSHEYDGIRTVKCKDANGCLFYCPEDLTHAKPNLDTWERIEEDARLMPSEYTDRYRVGRIGFEAEDMRVDLVRRCRALAERGE